MNIRAGELGWTLIDGEVGGSDFSIEPGFDFSSVGHGTANEGEDGFAYGFNCFDFVLFAVFDEFVVVVPFDKVNLNS